MTTTPPAPRKSTPGQLGCLGLLLLVAGPLVGGMLLQSALLAVAGIGLGVILIAASLILTATGR